VEAEMNAREKPKPENGDQNHFHAKKAFGSSATREFNYFQNTGSQSGSCDATMLHHIFNRELGQHVPSVLPRKETTKRNYSVSISVKKEIVPSHRCAISKLDLDPCENRLYAHFVSSH
jgi:hypothetical protein